MIRKGVVALLAILVLLPARAQEQGQEQSRKPIVYVVPIKKMIEPALLYVVRRGVDEAASIKADAIIFDMDTPGGRIDATQGILSVITKTDIPTYTFVNAEAFSAGAIIAMATKHIYMAPGSVIGAATPMMMSPMGGAQEMPDEVQEKMTSAVAAMVRAAAEQGGHDPELAEAMVRADVEYSLNGEVISEKGRLLTLTNEEASRPVGEDRQPLLSEGTVDNIEALLERIDLADAEIRTLHVTAAEHLARFVAQLAPILMLIGLGGLWLEFKTPGFGIFGILGITCLLLFFLGHHIAGLAGFEDVLIFFLGVALLAVEIFITPGFGVMGFGGLLLIFISFISAMSEHMPGKWRPVSFSPETLALPMLKTTLAFAGSIVLVMIAGKYLPNTRLFHALTLAEVSPDPEENAELLGMEGIAHSDLRPSGTAYFDGRKLDVVTYGDYIARQTPIRIVEVHGNRIVVEDLANG